MQVVTNTGALSPWEPGIFSLALYGVMIAVLIALLLFIASWLGEKKPGTEKLRPYESGVIPTGSARLWYPVPFYLVAIFFLIFDVEGAYIFSWAIAWENLGWAGWVQTASFLAVVILALASLGQPGGLEWGPTGKKN
jgi:NADH-quinone oxidoreductase subunit A